MSLESSKPMELSCWLAGEGRRDWIRIGNRTSGNRDSGESKHNRRHASSYHHGGVCVVGMLGSESEISREIPDCAKGYAEATSITSWSKSECALATREVGSVHSSENPMKRDRIFCNGRGAKGPNLVDVNSEAKERGMTAKQILTPIKIRKLQRTLYQQAKSKPNWRAWSLYSDLCRTDILEEAMIPASYYKQRVINEKYRSKTDKTLPPLQASMPPVPIPQASPRRAPP